MKNHSKNFASNAKLEVKIATFWPWLRLGMPVQVHFIFISIWVRWLPASLDLHVLSFSPMALYLKSENSLEKAGIEPGSSRIVN